MTSLLFAGAAAGLALAAAPDPRDEARVRQTVLAIPTNADLRRFDAVEPLFADPAVVDYSSLWGGEAQSFAPADLMAAWKAVLPGFEATWHEISDISVSVKGEAAAASARVDARHWLGGRTWRLVGRYDFVLRKQGDQWKVTRLTLTVTDEQGERALVDDARARTAGP